MLNHHSIARSWRNADKLIGIFIVLFTILLFIGLRSATQSGDSLFHAASARTGEGIFHPHHLLYTPVVRIVYLGLAQVCPTCDTILASQIHNIAWAAVAVGATFFIVRRLAGSRITGIAAALSLLVAQGFWLLTTQAEVYVPALGALSLLTALLFAWQHSTMTWAHMLVIALLFAAAVFYHQTNLLFAIPLGFWFYSVRKSQGGVDYRALITITSLAALIVLSAYIGAFYFTAERDRTVSGFIEFNLAYVYHPNPTWGTLDNVSIEGVYKVLRSQLWNFIPFPRQLGPLLTAFFAGSLLLLLAWNIRQAYRRAPDTRLRGFLSVWLAVYFAFFLWWEPWQNEFFTITLFPIIILGFLALADISRSSLPTSLRNLTLPALGLLVAVVFVLNLSLKIMPYHFSRGDDYAVAAEAAALAPPGCVTGLSWDQGNNLMYHFGKETVETPLVQLYFIQGMELPETYHFSEGYCILLPLFHILPQHGNNGYEYPSQWLSYLEWLFGAQYDNSGLVTSVKEAKVIYSYRGAPYVLIGPDRMRVQGLYGLMNILDFHIGGRIAGDSKPFTSWYIAAD